MVETMSRIRLARPGVAVLSAFLLAASVAYGQLLGMEPHFPSPVLPISGGLTQRAIAQDSELSKQEVAVTGMGSSKATGDTIVGVKLLKADHNAVAQPLKILIPADCV